MTCSCEGWFSQESHSGIAWVVEVWIFCCCGTTLYTQSCSSSWVPALQFRLHHSDTQVFVLLWTRIMTLTHFVIDLDCLTAAFCLASFDHLGPHVCFVSWQAAFVLLFCSSALIAICVLLSLAIVPPASFTLKAGCCSLILICSPLHCVPSCPSFAFSVFQYRNFPRRICLSFGICWVALILTQRGRHS